MIDDKRKYMRRKLDRDIANILREYANHYIESREAHISIVELVSKGLCVQKRR